MTPKQNEERLAGAFRQALARKRSVFKAGWKEGLGRIEFPWGRPGIKAQDYEKGNGISHILAKHGKDIFEKLPRIIAHGEVKMDKGTSKRVPDPEKRIIQTDQGRVVFTKKHASRAWIITGYQPS